MRRCKAAHQSCLFLRQADLLGAIPLVVRTNFLLEFLDGWHALVYFHTSNTFAMTSQQAVSNEIVLGSPLIGGEEVFIIRRILVYKTEDPLVCSYFSKKRLPEPDRARHPI